VDELLRLPQRREAEIGRSRSADRPVHGTDAHLDLVLGVVLYGLDLPVDIAPTLGFRQILVTPGMRADGVPGCGHLLEVPDSELDGVPNALGRRLGRCNSAILPRESREAEGRRAVGQGLTSFDAIFLPALPHRFVQKLHGAIVAAMNAPPDRNA